MNSQASAFRDGQPLAWMFHRSTARWLFSHPSGSSGQLLQGREHPAAPWTALPPGDQLDMGLAAVLDQRVSCRAFDDQPLSMASVATILRNAYGTQGRSTSESFELVDRPVPSAGGLYPLEISLLVRTVDGLEPGIYHYVPLADGLEQLRAGSIPNRLVRYLFMGQPWVSAAAVVMIISAVTVRSLSKYGDRGYRYLLFEAGHVSQNIDLVATALGLGAINLGGFYDDELAALLRLQPEFEIPLYATALGVPASSERMARRALPIDDFG